jgi:tetratricopeptide (TPR) repeat protein
LDDLGSILVQSGKFHREAGRHAEAIQTYKQVLEFAGPALEKAPWHWYLRSRVLGVHRELADIYRELKDSRNEVLSLRNQLRVWYDDLSPVRAKPFLAPGRPEDAEEADKIREEIKLRAGGMKRFTVPCDFNGIKYPFQVYIMDLKWPKHPLEDQARWLLEERGGIIPKEVMDSFERLRKIAHENNVSFQDLCVYALGTVKTEEEQKLTVDTLGDEAPLAAGSPEVPGKAASDPLADLKARLVDLKTKLDNSPNNQNLLRETAQVYGELGQRLVKAKQPREGAEALRESVRLRGLLARSQPLVPQHRQLGAATNLVLGKALVQLKDFDGAFNCFHRRLDLLEQLQVESPSTEQRSEIADSNILFGELAELRGDRGEAMRWYGRAYQQGSALAARKIATLLQLAPSLADLMPTDLQTLVSRLKEKGTSISAATFPADFAKEVQAAQKAK